MKCVVAVSEEET